MDIVAEKKRIRKLIKERKRACSESELIARSGSIFRKIEKLGVFQQARTLMAYWSMPDEVFTHDFIQKWYADKTVLLPVIIDGNLKLRKFEGKARLITSLFMGIQEPDGDLVTPGDYIDLIIVPGMAFDHHHNRLGRGGGYYDRFLSRIDAYKLGVCFEFQLLNSVPTTPADMKMDLIVFD